MDCSLTGSSVPRILQARILEWVAMPSSRGSSWPRDQTQVSCGSCCLAGRFFTTEPPRKPGFNRGDRQISNHNMEWNEQRVSSKGPLTWSKRRQKEGHQRRTKLSPRWECCEGSRALHTEGARLWHKVPRKRGSMGVWRGKQGPDQGKPILGANNRPENDGSYWREQTQSGFPLWKLTLSA